MKPGIFSIFVFLTRTTLYKGHTQIAEHYRVSSLTEC